MKTLFHFLLALLFLTPAAFAQMGAGADSFGSATLVPPTGGLVNVDLRDYTIQAGEPQATEHLRPHTAWWKWIAPENGFCVVDTLSRNVVFTNPGSTYSIIAVYTGTVLTSLTRLDVSSRYRPTSNDFGDAVAVRFYAEKGRTYYFQLGSTFVTDTSNAMRFSVRPFPSKQLLKTSNWAYLNAEGKMDLAGMTATINPSGGVSGKLLLRSASYPFAGTLDRVGALKVSIQPKPKKGELPSDPVTLHLSGVSGERLGVEMPGNSYRNESVYETLPILPVTVGNWSGHLQYLDADDIEGPVLMKVKPNKTVSFVGRGPDGVAVTASMPIMKSGEAAFGGISFLKFLGKNGGGFSASLSFVELGSFFMNGSSNYIRPGNPRSVFYPAGLFTSGFTYIAPFTKPLAGERAASFLNASAGVGKLRIKDPSGELGGDADLPLTFDTNNKFVFAADAVRKPMLKLNTTTGQVTGSIILAGKKRTISGTLYATVPVRLRGYITGTTRNVAFEVIP